MRRRDFLWLMSGTVVAMPFAARAQNAKMPVIGLLSSTDLPDAQMNAFLSGLGETGYFEDRNMTVLLHSADGNFDRLPALAADLVSRQVAVIVAMNSPVPARVAKAATTTIPIVFAYGGDPIVDNLVSNFSRPEANVTGTTFIGATLSAKRLELLNEIVPGLTDIALLVNPKATLAESQIRDTRTATKKTGQRLHILNASTAGEVESAFAEIGSSNAKALLVGIDPTLGSVFRDQIISLAARYKIPTMHGIASRQLQISRSNLSIHYSPGMGDRRSRRIALDVVADDRFIPVAIRRRPLLLCRTVVPNATIVGDGAFCFTVATSPTLRWRPSPRIPFAIA